MLGVFDVYIWNLEILGLERGRLEYIDWKLGIFVLNSAKQWFLEQNLNSLEADLGKVDNMKVGERFSTYNFSFGQFPCSVKKQQALLFILLSICWWSIIIWSDTAREYSILKKKESVNPLNYAHLILIIFC